MVAGFLGCYLVVLHCWRSPFQYLPSPCDVPCVNGLGYYPEANAEDMVRTVLSLTLT